MHSGEQVTRDHVWTMAVVEASLHPHHAHSLGMLREPVAHVQRDPGRSGIKDRARAMQANRSIEHNHVASPGRHHVGRIVYPELTAICWTRRLEHRDTMHLAHSVRVPVDPLSRAVGIDPTGSSVCRLRAGDCTIASVLRNATYLADRADRRLRRLADDVANRRPVAVYGIAIRQEWLANGHPRRHRISDGRLRHERTLSTRAMPVAEDLKHFNALGTKMAGAMAGVGVKLFTHNDLVGAGAGAAVAVTLEAMGNLIIRDVFATRPKVRVARAVGMAHRFLIDRIESGIPVRIDGFVHRMDDAPSAAEEVTEAALQVAMDAAQERKVDFIGHMLAYIATEPSIDPDAAHLLIGLAGQLTFRAFALLKLAGKDAASRPSARPRSGALAPPHLHPIQVDVHQLFQQGLVEFKDGPGTDDTYLIAGVDQVDGARMFLTPTGRLLYDCLGLEFMDDEDFTVAASAASLVELSRFAMNQAVADGGDC